MDFVYLFATNFYLFTWGKNESFYGLLFFPCFLCNSRCFVVSAECGEEGKIEEKENPEMATTDNHVKEFTIDDESSPRAILETPVSGTESDNSGSSESFSSVSPEKSPAVTGKEVPKEGYVQQLKSMIDVFKFKSVRKLTAVPLLSVGHDISRKGFTKKLARIRSAEDSIDIGAFPTKPSWRNFDYEELAAATGNFSYGMNQLPLPLSLSVLFIYLYNLVKNLSFLIVDTSFFFS